MTNNNSFFQNLKTIKDWQLDFKVISDFIDTHQNQSPLNSLLKIFPSPKSFFSKITSGAKYPATLRDLLEFAAFVSKVKDPQLSVQDSFFKGLSTLNEVFENCLKEGSGNLESALQKSHTISFPDQGKFSLQIEKEIIQEYETAQIPFQPLGLSNTFLETSRSFVEFIPKLIAAANNHSQVEAKDQDQAQQIFHQLLAS